jgi:hypothetical protein
LNESVEYWGHVNDGDGHHKTSMHWMH